MSYPLEFFIKSCNDLTCVDVAKKLSDFLLLENRKNEYKEIIKNMDNLKEKDSPIFIFTGKFDYYNLTIIRKDDNIYCLCSRGLFNYENDYISKLKLFFNKDVEDLTLKDNEDFDFDEYTFYYPQFNSFGKEIYVKQIDKCVNCGERNMIKSDNEIICISCYFDSLKEDNEELTIGSNTYTKQGSYWYYKNEKVPEHIQDMLDKYKEFNFQLKQIEKHII